MTVVKICGITNLDDARVAVDAGADMLGFNFYRPSPRFIEPSKVRNIIESLRAKVDHDSFTTVGVFVNEASASSVMLTIEETGIDAVQLHGDETAEFCHDLKQLLDGRFLIKALRVAATFAPRDAQFYRTDAIMLDSFHTGMRGGTGKVFDWRLAQAVGNLVPRLFLAGGLSPENVVAAITAVNPYAVDACSALESSPGRKDAARVRAFVQAVRNG